jgi:hypothetical protein
LERCCAEIDKAREAVRKAEIAHSKGGSVDAVVKANRRLVDAQSDYYDCAGGIIRAGAHLTSLIVQFGARCLQLLDTTFVGNCCSLTLLAIVRYKLACDCWF